MSKQEESRLELMRRHPMYFREKLVLDDGNLMGDVMSPVQRQDFEACDPALKYLTGMSKDKAPIKQFYLQRSRGYSKTTDDAINALWTFAFSNRPLIGYAAGEDKDQSKLILEQASKLLHSNPWLCDYIEVQRNCIRGIKSNSTLNIMSRDVGSSFGLTPNYMIAQEFTHWSQEQFWSSFYSSYAKRRDSGAVMFVSCNAGFGRGFTYNVKETARTNVGSWYYSAPDGWAPWYSEETIQEQRFGLPEAEFQRLWLNRWTDSEGEYITLTEAEACIDHKLVQRETAEHQGWTYVASLDWAEKHDRCAGCVMHQFNGQIVVDRMDVIDPAQCDGGRIPFEWVRNWCRNINDKFGSVYFVVDPSQIRPILEELRNDGLWIEEFDFSGGAGNWKLSKTLRQLILNKRIHWYAGCGELYDREGKVWSPRGMRDDLCTELASLTTKPMYGGKWRLDHHKNGHDDRTFVLGAGALFIVENSTDWEESWN